jgi:metallophosphoesterase superfamily enzyme
VESHSEEGFLFHHGHRFSRLLKKNSPSGTTPIHITGHFHPAHTLADGAGLRLKLPAFVQEYRTTSPADGAAPVEAPPEPSCSADAFQHWILPAFSPWAAGGSVRESSGRECIYPIHPRRILRMAASAA